MIFAHFVDVDYVADRLCMVLLLIADVFLVQFHVECLFRRQMVLVKPLQAIHVLTWIDTIPHTYLERVFAGVVELLLEVSAPFATRREETFVQGLKT